MFTEFWPAERRMGRLHAMGFDAYNLVNTISTGVSGELMSGATGRLYLQDDGRLRRHLAWGRFEGGNVVSLPGPDSAPESSEAALESDGSSEPAEWRLLQLNP